MFTVIYYKIPGFYVKVWILICTFANIIMATPIKITPRLSGRQSYNFNVKIAETSKNRESKETRERISSIVEKVLSEKKSK